MLGMKHFPVQVTGGIALHRGDIAEMQTGEGKTLVATLWVEESPDWCGAMELTADSYEGLVEAASR